MRQYEYRVISYGVSGNIIFEDRMTSLKQAEDFKSRLDMRFQWEKHTIQRRPVPEDWENV